MYHCHKYKVQNDKTPEDNRRDLDDLGCGGDDTKKHDL